MLLLVAGFGAAVFPGPGLVPGRPVNGFLPKVERLRSAGTRAAKKGRPPKAKAAKLELNWY